MAEQTTTPDNGPIALLATYLTATGRVSRHSMGIQMGGVMKEEATHFFAVRSAFGIDGYVDQRTAVDRITGTLARG